MLQERAKEWTRSWEQQGIEKGMQKGLQKGIQKGIQKGLRQGRREGEALLLSRLLIRKFGPIPDEVKHQLDGAEAEQLLRWGERVLTAETLEQVFT